MVTIFDNITFFTVIKQIKFKLLNSCDLVKICCQCNFMLNLRQIYGEKHKEETGKTTWLGDTAVWFKTAVTVQYKSFITNWLRKRHSYDIQVRTSPSSYLSVTRHIFPFTHHRPPHPSLASLWQSTVRPYATLRPSQPRPVWLQTVPMSANLCTMWN